MARFLMKGELLLVQPYLKTRCGEEGNSYTHTMTNDERHDDIGITDVVVGQEALLPPPPPFPSSVTFQT
jgi:hypothetical protein